MPRVEKPKSKSKTTLKRKPKSIGIPEPNAITKAYGEVRELYQSSAMLTVRELSFARLIAEEGYTQSDAYREVYEPAESVKYEYINQMACRIAGKPRVKAEIERIRLALKDEVETRQSLASIALDGQKVRERMAIDLLSMAVADIPERTRIKAWETLGRMRHVDALVTGATFIDATNKSTTNNLGVTLQDASSTRSELVAALGRLLSANTKPMQAIESKDVTVIDADV